MGKKIKNSIYITLGFIAFGIGATGVVIPVLPTTPFLLLASFFFAKGSSKFHNWFMGTQLYQKHLADFIRSRSMTKKTKVCLLSFATMMLLIAFIAVPIWYVKVLILGLLIYMYYYFIYRIKTIKEDVA